MLVSGDHNGEGTEGYIVLFHACAIEINTKFSLLEFHRKLATTIKKLDPPKIMKRKSIEVVYEFVNRTLFWSFFE